MLLAACGGGGSSNSPRVIPTIAPTASPTPTPVAISTIDPQAFVCPTSQSPTTVARSSSADQTKRRPTHHFAANAATSAFTKLAVTFNRATLANSAKSVAANETAAGVTYLSTLDAPQQNAATRIVSVPTANVTKAESLLRVQAGVTSIGVTGQRRFHTTTTAKFTTDPYFTGQPGTAAFETAPYAETQTAPGMWDMHAIGLGNAFGYSNPGTGYTPNGNALGSSTVKIAIIDTGEDATHPELSSKIVTQKCFITNQAETAQSTGGFAVDEDGHGTDVSGIAAAASNNGLGFLGAGGNASIVAYRVFPRPDDSCNGDNGDATCSADTPDIAAAIMDAVNNQHVDVISMSLGGGGCDSSGNDTDSAENAAIRAAIAANVIVVAAAGNDNPTTTNIDAPACANGVIAVGASALDDGLATGTTAYTTARAASATAANIVEYVPTYSQFGTPNTLNSDSSWGIVAPGGDPSGADTGSGTVNYLHWIYNIWTSTPFDSGFSGNCMADFNLTGTGDCRTLIAGTSMSTPHVAGAAALLIAVNSSLKNPATMKHLLCTTADDLGDTHQGCGRLNVYRAMAVAIGDTAPPSPAPTPQF